MKTRDIIEGLTILQKYRDKQDGYDTGAEHDTIFAYATDHPVHETDLARLIELGWFQEDADYDGDFKAGNYDPECSWTAYT